MAKPDQVSIRVPLAHVGWLRRMNYRGSYNMDNKLPENKDLKLGYVQARGWADRHPIAVIDNPSKEDLEEVMQERREEWALYKANTSGDGIIQLRAFEEVYVDEKNQLIQVKYLGNEGFRRASWIPGIQMELNRNGLPFMTSIVVIPQRYGSELERRRAQLAENEFKDQGFLSPSLRDRVELAFQLFELGATEKDLESDFNRGQRQLLIVLCRLNVKYPELKLRDRLKLKPTDKDYIDVEALDKEELRFLYQGSAKKSRAPARDWKEVDAYLRNPTKGQAATKEMGKDKRKAFATQNPVDIVRTCFDGELTDNDQPILEMIRMQNILNLAYKIGKSEYNEAGFQALKAFALTLPEGALGDIS